MNKKKINNRTIIKRVNRNLLLLLISFCFLSLTKTFAQVTVIENTKLQLENENLIITYDIGGTNTLEKVWLEIKTTSGKTIIAKTLNGDIGENISSGKNKRIIWNMKADNIDLQGEELNVQVLASQQNSSNTLSEITESFNSEVQNKNRDIIELKNGNRLKGRLELRFAQNTFKFICNDGNSITLNKFEIGKIKSNGFCFDSIYLKNGDKIFGSITEILPDENITIKTRKNNTYTFLSKDIKKVTTINKISRCKYYVATGIQLSETKNLLLRLGIVNYWGFYLQAGINDKSNFEGGVSKRIFKNSNTDFHLALGLNYGTYTFTPEDPYSYNIYDGSTSNDFTGLSFSWMMRFNRYLVNLGYCKFIDEQYNSSIGYNGYATIGIGYSF